MEQTLARPAIGHTGPEQTRVRQRARSRPFQWRAWLVRRWPPLFVVAAALVAVADGLLFGIVAEERDTGVFYYPLAQWSAEQLRQGVMPLWAPPLFSGYPLFADGEIGLAYPPQLLALLVLPTPVAFVVMRAAHLVLAGLGAYLLARAWRLQRAPAALAGITFCLGSFFSAQIHHENIIRTAAWLPWTLFAAEQALRSKGGPRIAWGVLSAVFVGVAGLGLHVQILATSLLIAAAYGLGRAFVGPVVGTRGRVLARLTTLTAVFAPLPLLAAGLAAVQLVPLGELARFSLRGGGIAYDQAARYSLTLPGLLQTVFPFFFRGESGQQWGLWTHWESYLFVGLAPFLCAGVALIVRRGAAVWLWGALAVVGTWLALGQYAPLNLHYFVWQLPGMAGLRAPGRWTLLATLALGMLAAYGLQWLLVRARRPGGSAALARFAGGVAACTAGLALVLGAVHAWLQVSPEASRALIDALYLSQPRDTYPLSPSSVYWGLRWSTNLLQPQVFGALLGLGGMAGLFWWWQRAAAHAPARGWFVAFILGASVVDLLLFAYRVHPRTPLGTLSAVHPAARAVQQLTATLQDPLVRVLASPVLEQVASNRLVPLGIEDASGYTSLESRWHRDYQERVWRVDDDLLDLWNVRYLIEPSRYGQVSSYGDVEFLSRNPIVQAPPRSALGRALLRLPAGRTIAEIRVVSALVAAVDVPQGTPMAELLLRGQDGRTLATVPIRAGREAMDWGADLPAIRPILAHQRVESAGRAFEWGQGGERLLSYAAIPLPEPVQATTVEVRAVQPRGEVVIYGIAAVDTEGTAHQLFGRSRAKYVEQYRDEETVVLENTRAFPRAYVVPSARQASEAEQSLDLLTRQPFNPARQVVLARDTPAEAAAGAQLLRGGGEDPLAIPDAPPVGAQVMARGLAEVRVRASSTEGGFLVLSDSFYPGWTATVNGQPTPILRGNLLFRAVQVPPGPLDVVFRYQPASVTVGLAISVATALLCGGLVLVGFRSNRRGARATTTASRLA